MLLAFPLLGQDAAAPSKQATSAIVEAESTDGYSDIYDRIYFRDAGYTDPIFISAAHLTQELAAGGLDRIKNLYSNPISHQLGRASAEGCANLGNAHENIIPESRSDFASAASNADNILVAKVIARSPGFLMGTPGTLLRLESKQIIKGKAKNFNQIFVEIGTFKIGDFSICKSIFTIQVYRISTRTS